MTLFRSLCPPPPRNVRRVLRVVGWNLLFILSGLLLIGIAGEVYFRLTIPFTRNIIASSRFIDGVGYMWAPHSELRFTNYLDYWAVQRTNSLGFMDREPVDSDRAAEGCHITVIGDSFVEAVSVPVSDKMQVRLEEMAAREAPHLNVTTSAFGISGTGQVNQLPLYDVYARHTSPDLVVLVFFGTNDPKDNSAVLYGLVSGHDPDHMPYWFAYRDADVLMAMRPPDPDFFKHWISQTPKPMRMSWITSMLGRLSGISYFTKWLHEEFKLRIPIDFMPYWTSNVQHLMKRSEYAHLFKGREPAEFVSRMFAETNSEIETAITREAWDATEFGLRQFKQRTDHDGAALMVLTVYDSVGRGSPVFDRLSAVADSLNIPVVSQYDYIVKRGFRIEDAYWGHDEHWTPAGHRWAAEAIWEYINAEWKGECPTAVPQPDIKVDWIRAGRSFNTPEGEMFVESFPTLNSEGYESVYSTVVSGSPVARSDWNVYLYSNGLTYAMEPCSVEDTKKRFYLHVFPEDDNVLTPDRWSRGFDNISFDFYERGEHFNGKCIVSVELPEYEIDYIRTGQVVKVADSEDVPIWGARYNFALPEILDAVRELRRTGRDPDIRSDFDVYIYDGKLLYVKESCTADDRDRPFFLHVFPADEKDLPDGREESGFYNLGFDLMQKGGTHDGDCFAAVDLPEYEIANIRTGQIAEGVEIWIAYHNFAFSEILDTVRELRRTGRDPDIRSDFDVYIDNNQLIYVKESCTADDRDLPFFLHVFPTDENDLPDGREVSGFDNLGFELMQKGGTHDGDCFAAVDLPEYKIASIRTGQFVRGEGEVWEASIEFAE